MKKFFIFTLAAAALVLTACKNDLDPQIPDTEDCGKEKISFSLSDGTTTRAGFTGNPTRIVARFQSDNNGTENATSRYTKTVMNAAVDATGSEVSFSTVDYWGDVYRKYWDDAFGRSGYISVYAVAIPNTTDATKLTEGKLAGSATAWATEATPNNNIEWDVTYLTTQTTTTLSGEDLVYSNNIQNGGVNGRYVWNYDIDSETGKEKGYPADNGRLDGHEPGRLVFTQKGGAAASDAGHFDKGHLMFKHSLSRLTVVLVPGSGFAADRSTASDFKFNQIKGEITSGNIQLLDFPVHGVLNIKSGSWTIDDSDGTQDILQMIGAAATSSASAPAAAYSATAETYLANRTYSAQMLPGKVFGASSAANVMQFTIDNNTYYITEKMVYDALTSGTWYTSASDDDKAAAGYNVGTSVTMTQGHNYTLALTVNKTGIANVTATLAPWVEVAGNTTVNNAHITLSLNTSGTTCDKDIDLYRLVDNNDDYDADQYVFTYQGKRWFGDYLTDTDHKTTLAQSAKVDNKWTTPWYFESNKEYYHFRTVNSGETIKGNTDETKDYFEIAAGPVASTDPHWGAPMQSTSTTWLKYDIEKGYEAHLHYAIGATESQIAIQELHMMSKIEVMLETPNDGGKVALYDDTTDPSHPVGTIVKITRLAKNGTVEMGRGLVTPLEPVSPDTWGTTEVTMTSPSTTSAADYFTAAGVTNRTQSKTYSFAVVPQSLSRNFSSGSDDDYVGIFIQTPDKNQYYVVKKLSEIYATTVTDQRDQTQYNESGTAAEKEASKIKRWFPGHTYKYTFTISKTKIENVTCTVADWVTVTGQNTPIDLED